jgi:DNA-binding CsgD family transcriptional regulator
MAALDPAVEAGLLKVGRRVVFAHPLVRSAAYRSAKADERRRAHSSLAEATDPETAPDRRAWHRAGAAVGVDDDVAAELERSASRAQSRGGVAAAAAFLERSAALTADPAQRVERALAAANASLLAGALDAALALVAIAETGTPDALQRARAELLRAQIAFATDRGGSAPALLIRAVKQIEPLDARLARASYFEALSAAELAARLAGPGGSPRDVASAVKTAPPAPSPPRAADLLLDGWATLFENGEVAAMPTLQEALNRFDDRMPAAAQIQLFWLATITAAQVWDDARWEDLAERHVDLVRGTGLLTELPLALSSLAVLNLFKGRVSTAARQIDETAVAIEATAAAVSPWGALVLAAFRGREHDALPLLKGAATDATRRGEGVGLTMIAWGRAVLHNGLREYDKALAAGIEAAECPTNSGAAAWSIAEVVEAAVRRDRREIAREYGERLAEIADAAGTDWSLGVSARTRALLSANTTAEELYQEALERLERCDMRVDLARSHLLYGEWLRRRKRRADARVQLRAAHDLFTSMGLEAFAERARNELSATGERVRKRTEETRDDLTAQERQIAQLAADGLSNPEIGTRLFLSPKTIEWHLGKVFLKLGIKSRANLRDVLPSAELG